MSPAARHYEELIFWQLATALKIRMYDVVERPNVKHDFKYVDQVRSSAASGPSNIAEGFGRRSNAEFLHYLDIARGSLNEIQNHLKDGVDRRYIQEKEFREMLTLSRRALAALAKFQRYLRRNRRPPRDDEGNLSPQAANPGPSNPEPSNLRTQNLRTFEPSNPRTPKE